MRFVLISTHIDQTTGYSKVAHNLLRQLATLAPKVKTYHFGFQRHPTHPSMRKAPAGIVQYDAAANEDPKEEGFGFNKVYDYLDMVNPDIVMIYNDPLVICKFIEAMKHKKGETKYKLWLYVDQVYDGIAQPLIKTMNEHADRIYCFTELWKKKYLEYEKIPDVQVLEHAVDPMMFSTLPGDARRSIRINMNIPQDGIVLLNANRNSQRKRLDVTISGFVRALQKNPKLYLIVVTNLDPRVGAYYDVQRIFINELETYKMKPVDYIQKLVLVDNSPPNVIGDDGINQLYNVADIGLNTSDGEGFGLCQLEHLYTGAPQIVVDTGSYRSFLTEDVAEFIPAGERVYFSGGMPLGLYAPNISAENVAQAMLRMADRLPEARKKAEQYQFKSWASVCDSWLEDILTGLGANGSA